jgi:hypothetical protein
MKTAENYSKGGEEYPELLTTCFASPIKILINPSIVKDTRCTIEIGSAIDTI